MIKLSLWRKLFLIFLLSATLFSIAVSYLFFLKLNSPPGPPVTAGLMTLFLEHFQLVFPFSLFCFMVLYFFVFLYLKTFLEAGGFLIQLFSPKLNTQQTNSHLKKERRHALFYLSHTKNPYLKKIRPALNAFLTITPKKEEKAEDSQTDLSFSNIIQKAKGESRQIYPHLKLQTELKADIKLPFCANIMFQALWELVKNAHQASPTDEPVTIRTYEKGANWFCCEVEDKGPGMNRAIMEKASQLYWTTKKKATGLGLPFVQSALSRIGGLMKLQSSKAGGLKVLMFIPKDYLFHIHNFREQSTVPYHRQDPPL